MRLEFTRVGLLAELANHYTTRGAFGDYAMIRYDFSLCLIKDSLKINRYEDGGKL